MDLRALDKPVAVSKNGSVVAGALPDGDVPVAVEN
jgi:hypothetical protein